jgi:hypothetical protein
MEDLERERRRREGRRGEGDIFHHLLLPNTREER